MTSRTYKQTFFFYEGPACASAPNSGTRLLAEAKNDKEKLARELQAGATQPAKRGIGAGC